MNETHHSSSPQWNTNNNPWFAVSLGLFGVIVGFMIGKNGGVIGGAGAGTTNQPTAQASVQSVQAGPSDVAQNVIPVDKNNDHILGNPNAKVALIEYSDFECPFCKRHFDTIKQIESAYKDDVMIVYRHFPLSFHQNAQKEAEASECVAELGGNDAFWKFHDAIFTRTAAGGTGFALDKLPALAKELGLDEAKFKTCLDSGKYAQKVQQQETEGSASGVDGTPGNIIVNLDTNENKLISGAYPFDNFKTVIDKYLGK